MPLHVAVELIEGGEDSLRLRLISTLCVISSCLPLLRLRLLYLDRHDRLCVDTSQVLDVLLPTSHGEYFALTPHFLASGVSSVYLQGIDNTEVISAVRSRGAPTMPASAGLLL